ncbi:AMP-binding protein [Micromonospora okii]|uniref:AMP-binding protein n=1 Tax=Micromonospora okii TaxID=1182970 RepID=UPI001E4CC88B|nr:AMP-binding protein [Micromonospora okii]
MSQAEQAAGPTILDWLAEPATDRGLHFADTVGDGWTFVSYARLAALVARAAGRLREAGVKPGEAVPLVCPTSPAFVAGFFGALALGATPCPVAPPVAYRDPAAYVRHLSRVVELVDARVVVTTAAGAAVVPLRGVTVLTNVDTEHPGPERFEPAPPTAVVQFSSGSTGPQRGVQVSMAAMSANIAAIRSWLSYTEDDAMVSWLPLHHDMGLVGALLMPMTAGTDVWMLQPEQFLRSPARWLSPFRSGATTSVAPTFGLAHLVRRARVADLRGLDLRTWRSLVVGAEPVRGEVLDAFTHLLAPYGFEPETLLPAYGLAEATLAVTGTRSGRGRRVRILPGTLAPGQPVQVTDDTSVGVELVGSGEPLPGVQVRLLGPTGAPVPDGAAGEIEVRGCTVATGYLADDGPGRFDGVVRTGDVGFRRDGNLFVVGRLGDSTKQFGRWLFAEELESVAVARSPRPTRTVVLLGGDAEGAAVVAMVEDDLGDSAAAIGGALANRVTPARVRVYSAPEGWIARTTSGKPQRREMWRRLVSGDTTVTLRWDSLEPGATGS